MNASECHFQKDEALFKSVFFFIYKLAKEGEFGADLTSTCASTDMQGPRGVKL